MQALHEYGLETLKWTQESLVQGVLYRNAIYYQYELSSLDQINNCNYIGIGINYIIENDLGRVVDIDVKKKFSVRLENNENLLSNVIFLLAAKTAQDFAQMFYDRVKGTDLQLRTISQPLFEELQGDIQKCVDSWNRQIRFSGSN